jgi:hypothetical protein
MGGRRGITHEKVKGERRNCSQEVKGGASWIRSESRTNATKGIRWDNKNETRVRRPMTCFRRETIQQSSSPVAAMKTGKGQQAA